MPQRPSSQAVVHGQCYCGAVRLKVKGDVRIPINCHCTQCRRLSGAAFTTWFSVKPNIAGVLAGALEGMDLPAPDGDYFVENTAVWFHMASGHSFAEGDAARVGHDASASSASLDRSHTFTP